jgi:hypothetical protein
MSTERDRALETACQIKANSFFGEIIFEHLVRKFSSDKYCWKNFCYKEALRQTFAEFSESILALLYEKYVPR